MLNPNTIPGVRERQWQSESRSVHVPRTVPVDAFCEDFDVGEEAKRIIAWARTGWRVSCFLRSARAEASR